MSILTLRPATQKIKQFLSSNGFRVLNEIEPKRANNLVHKLQYYIDQANQQMLLEVHQEGGYRLWFCHNGNDVQPDIDTILASQAGKLEMKMTDRMKESMKSALEVDEYNGQRTMTKRYWHNRIPSRIPVLEGMHDNRDIVIHLQPDRVALPWQACQIEFGMQMDTQRPRMASITLNTTEMREMAAFLTQEANKIDAAFIAKEQKA